MASERLVDPATLGLVIAGGTIGAGIRALLVLPFTASSELVPLAAMTSAINVAGSLLLGVVVGSLAHQFARARAFLGTGVLGGFTTYSAFAVHTVAAVQLVWMPPADSGATAASGLVGAVLVVVASVAGGLLAAVVGLWIGRRIADSAGEIEPIEDAE